MSTSLIDRIERKLKDARGMDQAAKKELSGLLTDLRAEVASMENDKSDEAESIAAFAGAATHEAMREETNPRSLQLAVDGLSSSVEELESEHPRLVEITNSICTMLSNLGI